MPSNSPILWIVATPLGNIGDLSSRAKEILNDVDLVLAEDTRRAGRLFKECGVDAKRMESFFEHNEQEKTPGVLKLLRQGKKVALVSDAGTPLLADPGFRLVRACRREGIAVAPVPGPFAPAAALSAAGIAPTPFSFLGFPPRGEKDRKDLFASFASAPGSLVFFERKDRLWETLKIAREILGDRELAICRELTKPYEEIIFSTLETLEERELLGEITVVIGPPSRAAKTSRDEALKSLKSRLEKGMSPREAANAARADCVGWSGKELYKLLNQ